MNVTPEEKLIIERNLTYSTCVLKSKQEAFLNFLTVKEAVPVDSIVHTYDRGDYALYDIKLNYLYDMNQIRELREVFNSIIPSFL